VPRQIASRPSPPNCPRPSSYPGPELRDWRDGIAVLRHRSHAIQCRYICRSTLYCGPDDLTRGYGRSRPQWLTLLRHATPWPMGFRTARALPLEPTRQRHITIQSAMQDVATPDVMISVRGSWCISRHMLTLTQHPASVDWCPNLLLDWWTNDS
jgi:hypothetical protein